MPDNPSPRPRMTPGEIAEMLEVGASLVQGMGEQFAATYIIDFADAAASLRALEAAHAEHEIPTLIEWLELHERDASNPVTRLMLSRVRAALSLLSPTTSPTGEET